MHQILAQTSLFSGLTAGQLDQLHAITQQREVRKGEAVFWEGEEGIGFYIVAEGLVKIFKLSAEGKEQILHIYGPGHPFGEVAVFAGRHFPANAQAVENSRLIFLPRSDFIGLITASPSLAMNMLGMLSMRLRQFTIQVENLSLKEVPGRLASYLIYLAGEQNSSGTVSLPVSKGALASLLGTIPETLSRIFNKMASQGIIAVQGGEISLLDREALEELAQSGRLAG